MPPCLEINCADLCCKYGVDVLPEEYDNLISHNLAQPGEFTGPEEDEEGVLLYRTREGKRGCVFLSDTRGCRLHNTQYKPSTCLVFPRDRAEALEAYQDGYLPCIRHYLGREELKEIQSSRSNP
jgi:Fe-S-cluster containining protein